MTCCSLMKKIRSSIIDDLVNSSINLTWMCRIKQKKRNIGIYDYAHIALWDSSFRPTAIKLVAMLIINGI